MALAGILMVIEGFSAIIRRSRPPDPIVKHRVDDHHGKALAVREVARFSPQRGGNSDVLLGSVHDSFRGRRCSDRGTH